MTDITNRENLRFNAPKEIKVSFADDHMAEQYQSELSMFDTTNPDVRFFDVVDGEMVRLAGSELMIFRWTRDENYDNLYDENSGKVIYHSPVTLFGHYDPLPVEEELNDFGIELTNDQVFTFNKTVAENAIGRVLVPGDVIRPRFQNLYFEIFEVQEDSFEAYGVYHLVCAAKLLRDAENLLGTQYIPDSDIE
jgi:hypothetical protein